MSMYSVLVLSEKERLLERTLIKGRKNHNLYHGMSVRPRFNITNNK